jgi:hypothetical protein
MVVLRSMVIQSKEKRLRELYAATWSSVSRTEPSSDGLVLPPEPAVEYSRVAKVAQHERKPPGRDSATTHVAYTLLELTCH